jgi:hypothetical protein
VAVVGVLLFLTLGKEVTEKERKGTDASDRLLVERQGGTLQSPLLSVGLSLLAVAEVLRRCAQ